MSKRKLLLADDSITIQKVVNLTFADEGIEVISVGDGDSAMRKFDEFMPDLVMADVNMPGLSGYEVCRIIKRTEETQNIPVILLVGSFEPFDEAEARDAGADDFLTKPFQSIRQLVNKVTDLLNQRGQSATDEYYTENPPPSVVDQFAETLEFEKQNAAAASAPEFQEIGSEFGDAGMDDEMIEASPANDYLAASQSAYQPDTDFGKTQPLSSEDLKGFDIVPGTSTAEQPPPQEESSTSFETIEPIAEKTEEAPPERAEAASFDEEARKLGYVSPYDERGAEEREEVISETEPEIDYYLPEGDETEEQFEAQVTDAETLEPEIDYAPDAPREADFSQATAAEDAGETETQASETVEAPVLEFDENFLPVTHETESEANYETAESAPYPYNENEYSTLTEPVAESETEAAAQTGEPDGAPVAETSFDEAPEDEPRFVEDYEAAGASETESVSREEAEAETAPEEEAVSSEEASMATPEEETVTEAPVAASAPSFANFDDGDLLELPPLVEETGIRPQPKAPPVAAPEPEPAVEAAAETEAETAEQSATPGETVATPSFPPELIEAIAQKVAEQISAKTMADVLPQITELVMKKMAEENQKNEK